jgi:galactan endo-1,6-beta-galactosidase
MTSLLALMTVLNVASGYTVIPDQTDRRGAWEGWGCSICWWGNGVGNSRYQDLYADTLFTQRDSVILDQTVPGLGLSIVRYNVGGGGRGDVIDGATEKLPANFPWFKDIDGFWVNWFKASPESSSYDWSRDANQRSVLMAARDRGAQIEFFSNAPMWWMTSEKSSAGGQLQWWNRRDFAKYLATVVKQAQDKWGVKVEYVSPFNEPSAGWWNYPKEQEGCNISRDVQAEILGYLREELNMRGLQAVKITASDENAMTEGVASYDYFKTATTTLGTRKPTVSSLIDKVNVHGYSGLEPWRDNRAREALKKSVGTKKLWMSEFGDGDGGGMALAQSITEDINSLRASAWIYWQPIEPYSGWGLINAKYDKPEDQFAAERAKPTWIYQKYYTFAQFTRFLRPGNQMLGTNDHNTICGYDSVNRKLVFITVNYGNAQPITYDLSSFSRVGATASVTVTNTAGSKRLAASSLPLAGKSFTIEAEPNSVCSIIVDGAKP